MSTEDKSPKIKDSEVDDLIAEFGKPLTKEARDAIQDKLAAERARLGLIDHALKNASEKEQASDPTEASKHFRTSFETPVVYEQV